MPLPTLTPGLVVRYEYLWRRREQQGANTADKDHPACVVLIFRREGRPEDYVMYLPISHSPPREGEIGLELPDDVKRKAGLDRAAQWVLLNECNIDRWPLDLRALPCRPGVFHYGHLPPDYFILVRDRFVELYQQKKLGAVNRGGL